MSPEILFLHEREMMWQHLRFQRLSARGDHLDLVDSFLFLIFCLFEAPKKSEILLSSHLPPHVFLPTYYFS